MSTKPFDIIALILVVIGAINWGLIGFFNFNLVEAIFGAVPWLTSLIYALVGIAGIYCLSLFGRINNRVERID